MAGREQLAKNLRPIDAPIPPGIEPDALALRSASDDRAFLTLRDALRHLVEEHHPEASNNRVTDDENGSDDQDEVMDASVTTDAESTSESVRHYVRGRQAMLDGRYYVAITELQRASQQDPDSPRIRRELARAYLAMNNQSRAMEQYAALRRLSPDDAEAVFTLGLHAANRREFETAAAILGKRFLDEKPFDHDPAANLLARYTITFSLRQLGFDRALTELWKQSATQREISGQLFEQTMYAARLGSMYRQRAEVWRSVGDAHCRLGEFTGALDAYAISATLPAPDPAALHPRVIYTNLRLGRVHSAQYELLASLNENEQSISDRDIRLCAYLADTVASLLPRRGKGDWPMRLLAEHVRNRYEDAPDDPSLARATAALLPPDEARRVLREFVDRQPRDLDVVGSLLAWLGGRDLDSAVMLTVDMVEANPDLAAQYVNRLVFAVPDPVKVLESLDERRPSPETDSASADLANDAVTAHDLALVNVKARVLATLGATGEAWHLADAYRPTAISHLLQHERDGTERVSIDRQRNAKHVALLRLRLVTLLEEPSLLEETIAEIAPDVAGPMLDTVPAWIARTRLWRSFNRFDEAIDAAERAVSLARTQDESESHLVPALLEQARTYADYAASLDEDGERARWAEEAVFVAERVLRDDSQVDENHGRPLHASEADGAFEVILTIYGPNGILRDPQQFRDAAQRLYGRNPDSRLYVRMSAEEAISQGRYDLALERAMNLYDSHPHESGALELAMMAWSRMDQPDGMDQARHWLAERLARRPGDPALLEHWVQAMLRLDRAEETIRSLEQALAHHPRHVTAQRLLESVYRNTGRTDLAFPLGERRLLNRPRGVRREVELAALYGGMGMEREAINRLEWLNDHRDQAGYDHMLTAIAILGRIEPTDSRHDELALSLIEYTVLDRGAHAPLQVYGNALRSLGRQDRVDDPLFGTLVEHASQHALGAGSSMERAMSWRNLVQALVDDGLAKAAAEAARGRVEADAALDLNALSFLTNLALVADAAVHSGAEQAERSIAFLQRLAARHRLPLLFGMDPPATLPNALYQTSMIYSIVGDLNGAKRVLEALLEIEPDNAMALNNLGYLRIVNGRDDEQTRRWIELAIELEPKDSHILDTVGWLRYKQGRFEDGEEGRGALSLIEESAERAAEPGAEVYDHLGDVLWRLGRHEEAVEAWNTAARILQDTSRREQIVRNYHLIQHRAWGLVVADPEEMYDRDYGEKLKVVREKIEAVEAGDEPPIAPTFAELRE